MLCVLYFSGAELLFHTTFALPLMEGSRVCGVIVENKSGRQAYRAGCVIDCTGDGDVAARAGARYISPFVGRFDDIAEDGLNQLGDVISAINGFDYGHEVEIIAASVRSPHHVAQAALMGADIATVPFGVLGKCVQHPLTDRGLERFLADWKKVEQA